MKLPANAQNLLSRGSDGSLRRLGEFLSGSRLVPSHSARSLYLDVAVGRRPELFVDPDESFGQSSSSRKRSRSAQAIPQRRLRVVINSDNEFDAMCSAAADAPRLSSRTTLFASTTFASLDASSSARRPVARELEQKPRVGGAFATTRVCQNYYLAAFLPCTRYLTH